MMSMAWETTTDDVALVLERHGVQKTEDELDALMDDHIDCDEIESGVLYYTDMDDQTNSMLSDIEDQLMRAGVISGEKQFHNPD